MPDMEPITREETLMNGDYIEPITREEMILAGEDIEPITRREWFLKKYRGGGDVEVVTLHANENTTYVAPEGQAYSPVEVDVPVPTLTTLEVDENGTYTAPSGTAYNEVEVDVPLPENAYLLKDIPNTPTAIATFTDGADLPMPKLEVAIEPVQDLHGYDAPWVGGAGKNKLNITATTTTKSELTFTVKEDGTIVVTGTKSSSSSTRIWFDIAVNISFSSEVILNGCPSDGGNTTYKLAGFVGDTGTGDYNDEGNGVTIPANTMLKTLSIGIAQQGNINLVFKPMIRLATVSDSTFAPYSNICPISGWDEVNVTVADDTTDPTTENVYTLDLDGTRYGGKVDLVSGVMTVDRAYVDLGTLNWSYASSSGRSLFTSNDITDYKHTGSNDIPVNAICECFAIISMSSTFVNGQMGMDGDNVRNRTIICDNRYSNASDFKTAMNGVQLVYELATPLTIQLPTTVVKSLRGVNNISADSGDVRDGKYFSKEV